ncbi:MAG: hypothetical protein H2067_08460 [Alcanivorax sp.]|nr:hypothetical protein [Alcanivorax sp.]
MIVDSINIGSASLRHCRFRRHGGGWRTLIRERLALSLTGTALEQAVADALSGLPEASAVLYRVVHGGGRFQPELVTPDLLEQLRRLTPLAPLHQPPAIAAMRHALRLRPDCRHLALFDSLPFQHLPTASTDYALPREVVCRIPQGWPARRLGFHGFAHLSMCHQAQSNGEDRRLITMQLGGGVSLTAWRGHQPVDTSMGVTALEGPLMATRSGDLDPGLLLALLQQGAIDAHRLGDALYRDSGLLGLSGISDHVDRIQAANNEDGNRALAQYEHRLRRYLGAFMAVLGGCDELVIGGGTGEHQPALRERLLTPLRDLGFHLDARRNARATAPKRARSVQAAGSAIRLTVAAVDEEKEMLLAAAPLLSRLAGEHHDERRI